MRYDLPNQRALMLTPALPAALRRRCLTLLPLLCMSLLSGCLGAKFNRDYSSSAARPTQPSSPLEGAWEGSWQSSAQAGNHIARAVVTLNSRGNRNVQLELSDFELEPGVSNFPFDKYWIDLRDIPVGSTVGAIKQFQTKIGLEKAHKSNLMAVAMTLQGNAQEDSLRIQFSTNDALNELDHGRIKLHRIVSQTVSSSVFFAFPTSETKPLPN
jgi:hypothetical protein